MSAVAITDVSVRFQSKRAETTAIGHVSLDMILKHYLQHDPLALQRAVEEITKTAPPRADSA